MIPIDRDVRSLQHIPLKDTWSATFHRDGHRDVAVGTKSGSVKIWDTKNKSITKTFPAPPHLSCVHILSFDAQNTSLAATMINGETIIYSLVSNVPVQTVKLACSKSISAMKFHHESRSLLGLATDEGHIVLRDVNIKKDKAFFENIHASPVSDFAFSPINKDVMLSSGYDKILQVYDIRLKNIVTTVKTSHILTCLTMNSDNQVALGSKNGEILVYDLRDLSKPLKILTGHDKQVSKVAFQPARKKVVSADISLKEHFEVVNKMKTPTKGRPSDVFFLNDTPPSTQEFFASGLENVADQSSFFQNVDFDKSNNYDFERKTDIHEPKFDSGRNMSKISTPVNKSAVENLVIPSPLFINGIQEDNNPVRDNLTNINQPKDAPMPSSNIDALALEELKNMIVDASDDSRKYFLHTMMALTKQKLYLERTLNQLTQEVQDIRQNQNSLIETNRMLVLQIEQMKMQQNHVNYN